MKNLLHFAPLLFNTAVPMVGIFVFHWSISDIFFLFFFEILVLGAETLIRICTARGQRPWIGFLGHLFRFLLIYPMLFLFLLIATGWLFDGAEDQGEITMSGDTLVTLIIMYGFNLLVGWFFNGKFKQTTPTQVEKDTYYHLLAIFVTIFVLIWPLTLIASFTDVNYGLAIGIILAKNAADYLIYYRRFHL